MMRMSLAYTLPRLMLLAGLLLAVSGCDSPLAIDTPRSEHLAEIADPVASQIGSAISIIVPHDSSSVDTSRYAHFSAVLVFDASGSMAGDEHREAVRAGHAFIDSLDGVKDEAAVVWYTQVVSVYQHMTVHRPSLHDAIDALPSTGATALWDGVYTALLELESKSSYSRRALIVLADDMDNSSTVGNPAKAMALARRLNVCVHSIALTDSPDRPALVALSDSTGGLHFAMPVPQALTPIYNRIVSELKKK